MIFALLFILAFIVGLVSYVLTNEWIFAVLFSMGLFIATTLADVEASEHWGITLVFGLPIVFFASLLGAYVVQLRRGEDELPEQGPVSSEAASVAEGSTVDEGLDK